MIIVREFENEAKELLIQVLSIPSVNHKDDEGKVAEYLQTYLTEAGIEAKVQRIDETHANLIAFIPGENHGKPTVWNGHIDTVPYGDLAEWETNPAVPTEKDGKLYARGASDMKSGIAAMAYTLATIVKSGNKNIALNFNDLVYIETFNNNLVLHISNEEPISIYSTLKEYEKTLPPNFLRCHKCFMVNMNHIVSFEQYKFKVNSGDEIPIPPKKYSKIVDIYKDYIENI